MRLTDLAVRKATPQATPFKLFDGGGLFLLVTPSGGKYWRLKYRVLGKEKLLALGIYPEVSLSTAREKGRSARQLLGSSIDPARKKKDDRRQAEYMASNTFRAVAEEWHRKNLGKWTPAHASTILRRFELHLFPDLGPLPVAEVKAMELLQTLRKLEKRQAIHLAHRLAQYAHAVFRYAVVTERAVYNPAADLRGALAAHKEEHHPTIAANELPVFFRALENVGTSKQTRLAVKLLLFTFVRQGELRFARWAEIGWHVCEWRIPAERMKMRDAHVVPLASQVIGLLRELHSLTGDGEFLFPSQQHRKHAVMSENTVNNVLREMGYEGRLVGHGFRSLASTALNEMGYVPDVIERQLAHRERNKVRAAYNRAEYLPQRRAMMQGWADFLVTQMRCAEVAWAESPFEDS